MARHAESRRGRASVQRVESLAIQSRWMCARREADGVGVTLDGTPSPKLGGRGSLGERV